MKVHTYVIATDAGSAPNFDPPFCTLAVCKPRIRKKAAIGDFVLAFAGKPVNRDEPHAVVWAGTVSEKLTFAEYWQDRRFAGKKPSGCAHPDNFYRPDEAGLAWVENPVHGPEAFQRDTGGIYVLVFDPAWRFGAHGPLLPVEFGLRMTVARRGERAVDLSAEQQRRLRVWLNEQSQIQISSAGSSKQCSPRRQTIPETTSALPLRGC